MRPLKVIALFGLLVGGRNTAPSRNVIPKLLFSPGSLNYSLFSEVNSTESSGKHWNPREDTIFSRFPKTLSKGGDTQVNRPTPREFWQRHEHLPAWAFT
jgi:hypothetical protein